MPGQAELVKTGDMPMASTIPSRVRPAVPTLTNANIETLAALLAMKPTTLYSRIKALGLTGRQPV